MADIGIWKIDQNTPIRLENSKISLEREFEDWIAADPSLLQEGLTIIGRRLRVAGGIIDLLALDLQGRWVVIELKRSKLARDVLVQAIDYASSIDQMSDSDLRKLLTPILADYGNAKELEERIEQQFELESAGGREITILIGGTGKDSSLDRMISYMERFDFSMTTVSFQLFEGSEGLLLTRDVIDEIDVESPFAQANKRRTGKALSIEEHYENARKLGVETSFSKLLKTAEEMKLGVRSYVRSVMITPPANRTRCLLVLTPKQGKLQAYCSSRTVREFYPEISEELLSDDICGHNVLLQGPGLDNTTLRFADILSALGTKT